MSSTNGNHEKQAKIAQLFSHAERKLEDQTTHLDNRFEHVVSAIKEIAKELSTFNHNGSSYQADMKNELFELKTEVKQIRDLCKEGIEKAYRVTCLLALLLAGVKVIEFLDKFLK